MNKVLAVVAAAVIVVAIAASFQSGFAQTPPPDTPTPVTGSVIPVTETPIPVIPTISPTAVSTVTGVTPTPVPTVVTPTATSVPPTPTSTAMPVDTNALIAEMTLELQAIHATFADIENQLASIEDLANKVPVLEASLVDLIDLYDQQRALINTVALNIESLATPIDWTQWLADWKQERDGIVAAVAEQAALAAQANQSASGLNVSATAMFEIMQAWIQAESVPGQEQATPVPAPPSIGVCNGCSVGN